MEIVIVLHSHRKLIYDGGQKYGSESFFESV